MGNRWGHRMMIAIGIVAMLGVMTFTHGRAADDPPASVAESASDIGNVQSRGLTFPKPTLPPPPATQPLNIRTTGEGAGKVVSMPSAYNCPPACSLSYPQGVPAVLTAVPAPGSTFAGWGGDCRGAAPCTLRMDRGFTVEAKFNKIQASATPLPSTVPVVESFKFTRRPTCDTRQLQAYQAAKPCVRTTPTSSTSEPSAFHELQIKGKNLLGVTVGIVAGPTDIPVRPGRIPGVGSQIVDCPAGSCIEVYLETFQATQRGQRTLAVRNPQGQNTTFQIEVIDGIVIALPAPGPAATAQLPKCPPDRYVGVRSNSPSLPSGSVVTGPRGSCIVP
ncbi:MAG: hypothetical protein HOP35_12325 [Nitrospira sp.]|nr:hypothetical protein [Nitrospira sp.]